jgi:hypothetical protein
LVQYVSDATAFAQHSTRELKNMLLGEVSNFGEKPDDELERALGVAYKIVAARGRGIEDLSLLLARAVVRLSSGKVEEVEQERQRDALRVASAVHATEREAQLCDAREKLKTMIRRQAQVAADQEQAIELMLAMLDCKDHRISDHPEWILELRRLSGDDT